MKFELNSSKLEFTNLNYQHDQLERQASLVTDWKDAQILFTP